MRNKKFNLYTGVAVVYALILSISAFFIIRTVREKNAEIRLADENALLFEDLTEETTPDVELDENGNAESAEASDNRESDEDLAITAYADLSSGTSSAGNSSRSAIASDSAGSTQATAQNQSSGSKTQSNSSDSSNQSGQNSGNSQSTTQGYTTPTVNSTQNNMTQPSTSAPLSSDTSLSLKEQVLQLTNQIRQEVGASDLVLDAQLSNIADIRAKEIVESFSHTRPNGSQFYTVMSENGYSYSASGENIAYGYSTASAVATAWKNSSGHYKNMISTNFNRLGVGVYVSNGTYYWVQLFSN